MQILRLTCALAALLAAGFSTRALGQANTVNVNILGGTSTQQNAQTITPGSFAGVVSDDGWNNINLSPTTYSGDLKDDSGNTTTLQIKGGANNSQTLDNQQGATTTPSTPDEQLNAGGIYMSPGIFITGITASRYDVYVYTLNDTTGTEFGLTDGTTTYYGTTSESDDTNPFVYKEATSTSVASPTSGASYVEFINETAGTLNISASYQKNGNAAINGIQIVPIASSPEPMTWVLLFTGAVGLLAFARGSVRA